MFEHDAETNRVSLKEGVPEPWLRHHTRGTQADKSESWLYCHDCKEQYFKRGGRNLPHIPFRDRASQCSMKPMRRSTAAASEQPGRSSQAEPESEPAVDQAEHSAEDWALDAGAAPDADEKAEEEPIIIAPPEPRPTLPEYEEKWKELFEMNSRTVPGDFGRDNLVPKCVPTFWQNAPHVPFDRLESEEAQGRLSCARPISGLTPSGWHDGIPTYAHNRGEVQFRRRATWQLASTLGLVLNRRGSAALRKGLKESEVDALHECIHWGRQPGNNRVIRHYWGETMEKYTGACRKLMGVFSSILPEGSTRARIRASRRDTAQPVEGQLGETLGDESTGYACVDFDGHVMRYDQLKVMESIVAAPAGCDVSLDIPGPKGKGWKRTRSTIDTSKEFDDEWRRDMAEGAQRLQDCYLSACDPHLDAKVFPAVHPHGSGSVFSEPGSGAPGRYAKSRLSSIQSFFRRSATWGFWKLDALIKYALFWSKRKKEQKQKGAGAPPPVVKDPVERLFGTVQPSSIPESTAWWRRQSKDLMAMTDDAENGLMQAMLTQSHNDKCPEMLAAVGLTNLNIVRPVFCFAAYAYECAIY